MSNKFKYAAMAAAFALTLSAVPAAAQDEAAAVPEVPASDLAYQGEITFWNIRFISPTRDNKFF